MARKEYPSVTVVSQTVEEDVYDDANVTLSRYPDETGKTELLSIWLEHADGECSHEFTREQFEDLVSKARELMEWN